MSGIPAGLMPPPLHSVTALTFPRRVTPLPSLVFVTDSVVVQAWLPECYQSLVSTMVQRWAHHSSQAFEIQFWTSDGTIRKEIVLLTARTNWETITPRLKMEKVQNQAELRERDVPSPMTLFEFLDLASWTSHRHRPKLSLLI